MSNGAECDSALAFGVDRTHEKPAARSVRVALAIAILKVLSAHPEGRASLVALNADITVLTASGREWTERLRRLAARAGAIDLFADGLVIRDAQGWQITAAGRGLLARIEMPDAGLATIVAEPPFGKTDPSEEGSSRLSELAAKAMIRRQRLVQRRRARASHLARTG